MHERKVRRTLSLLAALCLVLAAAREGRAQDAGPSDSPPPTVAPLAVPPAAPQAKPLGPGAVPAKKPAAKAAAAAAAKGIHLSPITPVSPSVHVHEKVLAECRLQTLLPQLIAERNTDIVLSDAPGGQKLELKIVDIHAPSGGWFSGPKWVTVEGRLLQGKTVKASFIAKETSMASATACGMLQKVVTVLASDIAGWLQNPQKGSTLGSAR